MPSIISLDLVRAIQGSQSEAASDRGRIQRPLLVPMQTVSGLAFAGAIHKASERKSLQ